MNNIKVGDIYILSTLELVKIQSKVDEIRSKVMFVKEGSTYVNRNSVFEYRETFNKKNISFSICSKDILTAYIYYKDKTNNYFITTKEINGKENTNDIINCGYNLILKYNNIDNYRERIIFGN